MKDYTFKSKRIIGISIIMLILFWCVISKAVNNEVIIPSIRSTFLSLIDIVRDKNFNSIVEATLIRTVVSFLICIFSAIVIGIFSSISKLFYNMMIPILLLLKSVPTMAIIILALIWLDGEKAPILIGFIVVFPILYESVLSGILNIDKNVLQMAEIYKVKKLTIIKCIYLPNLMVSIGSVIDSALGLNLKVVIAGEVLGQPKYSIGSSLQLEKLNLNTAGVFAWIILIVLITVVLENIISLCKSHLNNKSV